MEIFNDNSQNNNTGGSGQPGLPGQKGDPGIGFKLTADGNFDLDNKQMKNLSGGTDKSDAVNTVACTVSGKAAGSCNG